MQRGEKKMKNAEKYAGQIATLIASIDNGVCGVFVSSGLIRCSYCPLNGKCNNEEELKEWLLEEDTRGHGNAQAPRSSSL